MKMESDLDYYSLLQTTHADPSSRAHQLGPHSTLKELATAYRQRAKETHPDKNSDPKLGKNEACTKQSKMRQ